MYSEVVQTEHDFRSKANRSIYGYKGLVHVIRISVSVKVVKEWIFNEILLFVVLFSLSEMDQY